ncbi:hypothetical protein BDP27DRAFT_1143271, partial [Rhodocollybia butyracea]
DTEFAQDILAHLLSCGKYVHAQDVSDYLSRPDVQLKHGLQRSISPATAKRWMHKLGYRFVKKHQGLYVDGHERDDVVKYRQLVYLPAWTAVEPQMRSWTKEDIKEHFARTGRTVVVWFHDESIFYAHNWKKSQWVQDGESAQPYAKGEGISLMVADF